MAKPVPNSAVIFVPEPSALPQCKLSAISVSVIKRCFIYLFVLNATPMQSTRLLQSTYDICCMTELDMAVLPASSPCTLSRKLQIKLLKQVKLVKLTLYSSAHMLTIN